MTAWHRRVMVFVDGTNFVLRLSDYLGLNTADLDPHKPQPRLYELVKQIINHKHLRLTVESTRLVRSHWFGSYRGDSPEPMERAIWEQQFHPHLVKFAKNQREEKGVDVALAVELLSNAHARTIDLAWVFTQDEDLAAAVNEARRHGVQVWGAMFESQKVSWELRRSFDLVTGLEELLGQMAPGVKDTAGEWRQRLGIQ